MLLLKHQGKEVTVLAFYILKATLLGIYRLHTSGSLGATKEKEEEYENCMLLYSELLGT